MRYWRTPARMRRPTTPIALNSATPTMSGDRQRASVPAVDVTRREGREHRVLGGPAERPRGQHGRHAVERAGQDRTGEDLRLGPGPRTPMTRNPWRMTAEETLSGTRGVLPFGAVVQALTLANLDRQLRIGPRGG